MWIDANFKVMRIPVHDPHEKTFFINMLKGVGYTIIKVLLYENLMKEEFGNEKKF